MYFAAEPVTGATNYLLTQGVLGIVVIGVIIAFGIYYKSAEKKIADKDAKILELMQARLDDNKEVTKNFAGIIEGNAQASQILAAKIQAGKGAA